MPGMIVPSEEEVKECSEDEFEDSEVRASIASGNLHPSFFVWFQSGML
jgi:hypothetical protein